jgi:hypothetical protein
LGTSNLAHLSFVFHATILGKYLEVCCETQANYRKAGERCDIRVWRLIFEEAFGF